MNTIYKLGMGLMVGASAISCNDNDVLVESKKIPSKVFFSENVRVAESSAGVRIPIVLNKPAIASGEILIGFSTEYIDAFDSNPQSDTGYLKIQVQEGDTEAGFTIYPHDNDVVNDAITIDFKISEVSDGFEIGNSNTLDLTIEDDPSDVDPITLLGIPKSYETTTGNWRVKKTYEYNEEGKLSKVFWVTETPYYRSGTETYYYDSENIISRINYYPNSDVYFYIEQGRVVKSEKIENDIKKSYSLYDYDAAGNLGGMVTYHRQSDGSYAEGLTHIYLFWNSGNIYKHMTYSKDVNSDEHILLSTKTFDTYLNADNHFPMIETFPGVNMQPKLPSTYKLEEHGYVFNYTISYEYNDAGYVTRRNVSSTNGGSESTSYEWY